MEKDDHLWNNCTMANSTLYNPYMDAPKVM